jgi:hypothetical protein
MQTQTTREKAAWDKWGVVEADLDNNTDTRDNVIVYGKIRSIDGYGIISGQKKVNQRNIHSAFPIKEVRSDVMNSKLKTDLKAWLRKYPTPKEQQKHPFEEFTREKGAFENVKVVKRFLTTYGLGMYTQTQKNGNLTVSHYMIILQKLTSIINKDLMIAYFDLPPNYNFKVDVKNTRLRNNQKDYAKYLLRTNQGFNRIIQFINANMDQISRADVPTIFKYISNISGYMAIEFDPNNLLVNVS